MKNKIIDITTIKFILVGIINTLVGSGVMFFMYNILHASYWISSASNYIVGSIVSYFLNKYFTFQNRERSLKMVLKFIVNITVCYFIAYGVARPITAGIFAFSSVQIKDNISMLAGMCLFVGLNYIGQRFVVFRSTDKRES